MHSVPFVSPKWGIKSGEEGRPVLQFDLPVAVSTIDFGKHLGTCQVGKNILHGGNRVVPYFQCCVQLTGIQAETYFPIALLRDNGSTHPDCWLRHFLNYASLFELLPVIS